MNLQPKYILSYYDIPELFISIDSEKNYYISLFVDEIKGHARYLTRLIYTDELLQFLYKKTNIVEVFNKTRNFSWYYMDTEYSNTLDDFEFLISNVKSSNEVQDKYFPKKNYISEIDSEELMAELNSIFEIKEVSFQTKQIKNALWKGNPSFNRNKRNHLSFSFNSMTKITDRVYVETPFIYASAMETIDTENTINIDYLSNIPEYTYQLSKKNCLMALKV